MDLIDEINNKNEKAEKIVFIFWVIVSVILHTIWFSTVLEFQGMPLVYIVFVIISLSVVVGTGTAYMLSFITLEFIGWHYDQKKKHLNKLASFVSSKVREQRVIFPFNDQKQEIEKFHIGLGNLTRWAKDDYKSLDKRITALVNSVNEQFGEFDEKIDADKSYNIDQQLLNLEARLGKRYEDGVEFRKDVMRIWQEIEKLKIKIDE